MKRLRLLVCGGREWSDEDTVVGALNTIYGWAHSLVVIEGGARGADDIASRWADAMINLGESVELLTYNAQWEKLGKKAGPIRNRLMLHDGRPKMVLAFHDDLERSKGTKDMVQIARAHEGVSVTVIGGTNGHIRSGREDDRPHGRSRQGDTRRRARRAA